MSVDDGFAAGLTAGLAYDVNEANDALDAHH
jgi:hypothetical protein